MWQMESRAGSLDFAAHNSPGSAARMVLVSFTSETVFVCAGRPARS